MWRALVNELHQPCQGPTPPPTEADRILGSEAVTFRDPSGVSGTWDNLAATLAANGVVTFNPNRVGSSTDPVTGQAACLLPTGDHALCTAAVDDFATHYGGL